MEFIYGFMVILPDRNSHLLHTEDLSSNSQIGAYLAGKLSIKFCFAILLKILCKKACSPLGRTMQCRGIHRADQGDWSANELALWTDSF